MADVTGKERGTLNRGVSQRGTGKEAGNPGTFLRTESRDGLLYARYRAEKGTWVSASLVQEGYDKRYGKDVAYGAYLGLVLGPDGQPLKTPDNIKPTQEYLIPVGTAVKFEDQPITGQRLPQTFLDADPWKEDTSKRTFKDKIIALEPNQPNYPSFELKGPKPPSRVPRDAVAFWLALHRQEIIKAERDWNVSRLAIAGVIAWEALENPQAAPAPSPPFALTIGPGKMHLTRKSGQLTWPEVVEATGRVKELVPIQRKIQLTRPEVAINYIGAVLDFVAEVAETRDWNIRNNPEILTQIYHGWTAEEWIKFMKTKPANAPFKVKAGTMGQWIRERHNKEYLESAVGAPEDH